MRRLAIALIILTLAAGTLAATAFAEEGILPIKVALSGVSAGNTGIIDINGNSVLCTPDTLLGTEFTTDKKGTFTDFHCQKAKAFGLFPANTSLDEKEVLLTGGGTFEVCLINSAKLEFGLFTTFSKVVTVEVPAAKAKFEVKGSIIATLGVNALSKTKLAKFSQTKGVPAIKECGGKKAQLLASFNGNAFVEAGLVSDETLSATNGVTELELMDT